MIYHITSRFAWARARRHGQYSAPSLKSEGCIHCSTRKQVLDVANNFYRGQSDLLLLCIDENRLRAELRWEAPAQPQPLESSRASSESLFPHLYGVLNLDAVVAVHELNEEASGFALPLGMP